MPSPTPADAAAPPLPSLRQLWQAPMFLLGLLTLAGVSLARPLWRDGELPSGERSLKVLRKLLDQKDIDPDQMLALIERVQEQAHQTPHLSGQANYLIGGAYERLAEQPECELCREYWQMARERLEQAETLGLRDEDDRVRLVYCLAKAWSYTEGDPQRIVDALTSSVEKSAADPFEAYGLLAQAYLNLSEPNLQAALDATEKQLQRDDDDRKLAPVRLLRGKLLLRLQRMEEAREALRNVGVQAPPAIKAEARTLLANTLQVESRWAEAASLWKEALADEEVKSEDRERVRYNLGLCFCKTNQADKAKEVWNECLQGDEGAAAALQLAELRLKDTDRADALADFERAVRNIRAAGEWHNALLNLEKVRKLFEYGCSTYCEARDFERATQLARLYERLAPAGTAQMLRGQAAALAGRSNLEESGKTTDGAQAQRLLQEARHWLLQAGEAYDQAAADPKLPDSERTERFWLAAGCYLDSRYHEQAVAALNQFLQLAQATDASSSQFKQQIVEGWYRLGDAHRGLNHEQEALKAYNDCIRCQSKFQCQNRFAYLARYQLAQFDMARENLDAAQKTLEQNLDLLQTDNDDEAREKTLYALGHLYYKRRDQPDMLMKAMTRLKEALNYSTSAEALRARYELAECCRLRADEMGRHFATISDPQRSESAASLQKQAAEFRQQAVTHYEKVASELSARQKKGAMTQDEGVILDYLSIAIPNCYFDLGEYETAYKQYIDLANQHPDRPDIRLQALYGVNRCYTAQNIPRDNPQVKEVLQNIRATLQHPALDNKTREKWERWLLRSTQSVPATSPSQSSQQPESENQNFPGREPQGM